MRSLIAPTVRLHRSWLAARDEWPGVHQDGTGIALADDVDSPAGFADWITRLRREADESIPPAEGRVHASYWWIVEDDEYVGAITLRYRLNEFLLNVGGHIGYSVRPTARRRGLAAWALGAVLTEARRRGLGRVLITCLDDNLASARTIESRGGALEDVRDLDAGRLRRYWIDLSPIDLSPPAGHAISAANRSRN